MLTFRYSTVSGSRDMGLSSAAACDVLEAMQGRPAWDTVCVVPTGNERFPIMNISCHAEYGLEVQCFETAESNSEFLVTDQPLSSPEVYVDLGGQTQELWPRQLFVPLELALQALRFFLETGRENQDLRWVPINGFSRRTVRPRRKELKP
jgi:immunity protein Imm1 of predicted polymorphic toxin system